MTMAERPTQPELERLMTPPVPAAPWPVDQRGAGQPRRGPRLARWWGSVPDRRR